MCNQLWFWQFFFIQFYSRGIRNIVSNAFFISQWAHTHTQRCIQNNVYSNDDSKWVFVIAMIRFVNCTWKFVRSAMIANEKFFHLYFIKQVNIFPICVYISLFILFFRRRRFFLFRRFRLSWPAYNAIVRVFLHRFIRVRTLNWLFRIDSPLSFYFPEFHIFLELFRW